MNSIKNPTKWLVRVGRCSDIMLFILTKNSFLLLFLVLILPAYFWIIIQSPEKILKDIKLSLFHSSNGLKVKILSEVNVKFPPTYQQTDA